MTWNIRFGVARLRFFGDGCGDRDIMTKKEVLLGLEGLANKIKASSLQEQGFDTVEANHRLGFEGDERDFQLGAAILKEMRITDIKLITNNPSKLSMMNKYDINVTERIPLRVGQNKNNLRYLETKAKKSGHLM